MQEFELIELLTRGLPGNAAVVQGPGDDCAVLDLGAPGQWLLFKTDAVVEGIHFTKETAPESIGHKALARCLSDIAAMAGTPTAALVTIGLPKEFDPKFVEAIYAGMSALAKRHDTAIAGGETTTNPERIFISIAVLGTVDRERCVLRSGAKAGDGIFVTGELGGSILGKHLSFEPRLPEARWLAEHFPIHAMIDLSDGLAGDLPHILKASGKGAELFSQSIPISREVKAESRKPETKAESRKLKAEMEEKAESGKLKAEIKTESRHSCPLTPRADKNVRAPIKAPLEAALTDGEDFELLFTVPAGHAVALLDAWKAKFPNVRLSCIGKITEETGLRIRNQKGIKPLDAHGYVHFKES